MIDIHGLSFSYGDNGVLHDISLRIDKGEFAFILGPNGSGKSTLFGCILKLLKPKKGTISIDGTPVSMLSERELAKKVAFLPQKGSAVFSHTVLNMVLMGTASSLSLFSTPRKKEEEISKKALDTLGIGHLIHESYNNLSGGEQQLVLIARALAQGGHTIILDEPTSSLDFGNQLKVLGHIKELCKSGYTAIVSSHNPQHALMYASKVIALKNGTIICAGNPHDVINADIIKKLYDVDVDSNILFGGIYK